MTDEKLVFGDHEATPKNEVASADVLAKKIGGIIAEGGSVVENITIEPPEPEDLVTQ